MKIIGTKRLTVKQKACALKIWNNEYPKQLELSSKKFDEYLSDLVNTEYYICSINDQMAGWGLKFTRNSEKWFAILIDSKKHLTGLGTLIINKLKENESILNGWVVDHDQYIKLNGKLYLSPLPFYLKNGFEVSNDVRLHLPHLSAVKIVWKN